MRFFYAILLLLSACQFPSHYTDELAHGSRRYDWVAETKTVDEQIRYWNAVQRRLIARRESQEQELAVTLDAQIFVQMRLRVLRAVP